MTMQMDNYEEMETIQQFNVNMRLLLRMGNLMTSKESALSLQDLVNVTHKLEVDIRNKYFPGGFNNE